MFLGYITRWDSSTTNYATNMNVVVEFQNGWDYFILNREFLFLKGFTLEKVSDKLASC